MRLIPDGIRGPRPFVISVGIPDTGDDGTNVISVAIPDDMEGTDYPWTDYPCDPG